MFFTQDTRHMGLIEKGKEDKEYQGNPVKPSTESQLYNNCKHPNNTNRNMIKMLTISNNGYLEFANLT